MHLYLRERERVVNRLILSIQTFRYINFKLATQICDLTDICALQPLKHSLCKSGSVQPSHGQTVLGLGVRAVVKVLVCNRDQYVVVALEGLCQKRCWRKVLATWRMSLLLIRILLILSKLELEKHSLKLWKLFVSDHRVRTQLTSVVASGLLLLAGVKAYGLMLHDKLQYPLILFLDLIVFLLNLSVPFIERIVFLLDHSFEQFPMCFCGISNFYLTKAVHLGLQLLVLFNRASFRGSFLSS